MTKKVVAVTENWQISHVIVNDSMAGSEILMT